MITIDWFLRARMPHPSAYDADEFCHGEEFVAEGLLWGVIHTPVAGD